MLAVRIYRLIPVWAKAVLLTVGLLSAIVYAAARYDPTPRHVVTVTDTVTTFLVGESLRVVDAAGNATDHQIGNNTLTQQGSTSVKVTYSWPSGVPVLQCPSVVLTPSTVHVCDPYPEQEHP